MSSNRSLSSRFVPALSALLALLLVIAVASASGCGGREGDSDSASAPPAATEAKQAPIAPAPNPAAVQSLAKHVRKARKLSDRIELGDGSDAIDLPDDYPLDVPIHPDSEATRYVSSAASGSMATLRVDESPPAVRNFYVRALASEGWMIQSDDSMGGLTIVSAAKDERDLAVTIEDKDGETQIVVVVSVRPR